MRGHGDVGDNSPLQASSWGGGGQQVFIRERVSPGGGTSHQPAPLDADSAQLGRMPRAGWQARGPALGDCRRDDAGSTVN